MHAAKVGWLQMDCDERVSKFFVGDMGTEELALCH